MYSVKLTFYPSRITGSVPKGITILEAARKLGVTIEGPCGGTGKCGKDLVQVRVNKTLTTVLACRTAAETDMEIIIPCHEKKTTKIVDGFYTENTRKRNINPSVWKDIFYNDQGACFTKVYMNDRPVAIEEGDTRSQMYGIALDIGTTTLVASLVNLINGEIVGATSTLNPLVYYGHDVMSRIKYSTSHHDGLLRMHKELISAINLLIFLVSSEKGVKPENIYQTVAAGNTTMQHIFLHKEIKGIGEYPYKAEILNTFTTTAKELSISTAVYATVTILPCISAYVGGDTVSGLVAIDHMVHGQANPCTISGKFEAGKLPALFVDIGTNGEMVLLLEDRMVATSTAAGPCFEGMTISSGMRAGEGAIEHVCLGDKLLLEVIGNSQPRGICGSGLLDIVSELIRVGLVNSKGRLQGKEGNGLPEEYKKCLFEKNGKRHFQLSDDVAISQEDIRQVQLAKAAIRTGVEMLLAICNCKPEGLRMVIIAGAFGYHLKQESLFRVGFFPELKNARLSFVGNSSLEGAVMVMLNKDIVHSAAHIARNTQVIELSQLAEFESIYIREMHFP
ncbi:MAG: ASKHA domain-containing protein [Candidatus Jettenia sp.]|nr:MAG: ASKHA domain-containing protein [Candidatus Jettenia sp.]